MAGESAAFDIDTYLTLADPHAVDDRALIVLGVDGARFRDALAVRACEITTGYMWTVGIWERPKDAGPDYEHPFEEVDRRMVEVFRRFDVWRAYVDPQYIEGLVDRWQGRWGDKRVHSWFTNRDRQAAWAVRNLTTAIGAGDLSHDGDELAVAHIRQARKRKVNVFDDRGQQMHVLAKDRHDSPRKIDSAMADVLAWECRGDAIAAGADHPPSRVALFL
jgi:hypothetical protein